MGINGLLPALKSITEKVHVKSYAGRKVAIDAYSWLHKGVFSCAMEIALGQETNKFVNYCMFRVNMLRRFNVHPVLVFDGDKLPMKSEEESVRHRQRQANKQKAEAHMQAGNKAAAYECYQRCVDVTPQIAKQLIDELKIQEVEFVVAPYEADAQMAYLAKQNEVFAVITEDSDLLAYGCPRVLFKMDKTGLGQEIQLKNLGQNKDVSFIGFSYQMFLELCIMAGCDFLRSVQGIGIKKAHAQMVKARNFVTACKGLRLKGTSVPADYEINAQRTIWVFRHQRVFCSKTGKLVHLTELPEGGIGSADVDVMSAIPSEEEEESLNFLGPPMSDEDADQIAHGNMDPISRELFGDQDAKLLGTQSSQSSRHSWRTTGSQIQRRSMRNSGPRRSPSVQTNSLSQYLSPRQMDSVGPCKPFTAPRISGRSNKMTAIGDASSTTLLGEQRKRLASFPLPTSKRLADNGPQAASVAISSGSFGSFVLDSQSSNALCHDVQRLASVEMQTLPDGDARREIIAPKGLIHSKVPLLHTTIRGLEGDDEAIFGDISSPVTPRSTPFFHTSDVSPDILSDDLILDDSMVTGVVCGNSLGLLRKEDNTFETPRSKTRHCDDSNPVRLRIGLRKPVRRNAKPLESFWCSPGRVATSLKTPGSLSLPAESADVVAELGGSGVSSGEDREECGVKTNRVNMSTVGASSIKKVERGVDLPSVEEFVDNRHVGRHAGEPVVSENVDGGNEKGGGGFCSIEHVEGFAALAREALDRLEGRRSVLTQSQVCNEHSRGKGKNASKGDLSKKGEKDGNPFEKFAVKNYPG